MATVASGTAGGAGGSGGQRLHRGDLDIPVISHQLDPGTARAHLAGDALAFAGATDGQVQLGIDVAVLGRRLQLKACALGYGQVDGAVAVVNLQFPSGAIAPTEMSPSPSSTCRSPAMPVHSTSLALVEMRAGPVALFSCRSPLSIARSPGMLATSTSVRLE